MEITKRLITTNFEVMFNRDIRWIVIHYFGSLGTDEGVAAYFNRESTNSSAHYALDNDSISQCVLDKDKAWHCGDSGSGPYKHICFNTNSIGIEVKPCKLNKNTFHASDKDWYFEDDTIENLLWLTKYLMEKHRINIEHVIRHYDVTTKLCPRPFVGDDINIYYNKTGNQLWAEFKNKLMKMEDVIVTQEEFNTKMAVYLSSLKKEQPSAWSVEEREWAEEKNLITGDKDGNKQYKVPVTREQLAVILKRYDDAR